MSWDTDQCSEDRRMIRNINIIDPSSVPSGEDRRDAGKCEIGDRVHGKVVRFSRVPVKKGQCIQTLVHSNC